MTSNKIHQLLRNNRSKGTGSLNIQSTGRETTVYLYDAIVDTDEDAAWYGGVSAEGFAKQFAAIDADIIHLRVNSPGGSVFGGRTMETAVRNHSARVIAHVDGLAASAASFVIMGADEIEMSKGAFLMIHKAWAFALGNADDLLAQAAVLEQIDNSLAQTYADRTGMDVAELAQMMAAETWIEAHQAVEQGFADRVAEHSKAQNHWDLSAYAHAPQTAPVNHTPPPDRESLYRAALVRIRQNI